jgi:hypothetical protein
MMCVMNGPKGPSCVWSKAPICCKKYPAVAGFFMKKRELAGLIKDGPVWSN